VEIKITEGTVVEAIHIITEHAKAGHRVFHYGSEKDIWLGVKDPVGLYDQFYIEAANIWKKSGLRFLKKMYDDKNGFLVPGEKFGLKKHKGRVLDRKKWEICETITIADSNHG